MNNIQTFTVKVIEVEQGNGCGIFPTGTITFKHPQTGEATCIAMRPALKGVKAGNLIEIDWMDIGGYYDAIKGARIV